MDLFNQTMEEACHERQIPGAVLVAGNRTGSLKYARCFGASSLEEEDRPMKMESTMWMASCTKLLTSIAVMQCVEKGLLVLDEDVTTVLPEVKEIPILLGFDENKGGEPILKKREKVMTLRHLLTHSSGMAYNIFNPLLKRYQAQQDDGKENTGDQESLRRNEIPIVKKYAYPLVFEPGEGWEYSVGLDWAGQMVERQTSLTLDQYFQTYIFTPLGIRDHLTFHPLDHPSVSANLCKISWRHGGVNKFGATDNPTGVCESTTRVFWDARTRQNHGGSGIFGDMASYFAVLEAVVKGDEQILTAATWKAMFTPQLDGPAREKLNRLRRIEEVNNAFGAMDMDVAADWGLGGILNLSSLKSGRNPCSMAWGGYPNLTWWVDPTEGIAGIFGSQLCPPGDPQTKKLSREWERIFYAEERARRGEVSRL
ncbi:hypothetical protein BP5796_10879 [Coleophoma crateriformis]|uniref:Beta-lactamase-related domain-containing protein n=1 Tax=Coleophoma crateriformis TaxID=565419 RepID=A0A3D8QLE9_9HELO|nr:hypothetical protein BP5796_10879 [Coleophoma crateriformis]